MRIAEMNWMQVEQHVTRDRRAVLPLGSTEQHAQLSLCVDAILADRVSVEAAQPLDVPVFPAISYGLTPSFVDYAGTVTLRLSTLCALVCDVLGGMVRSGFRQIVPHRKRSENLPTFGNLDKPHLDDTVGSEIPQFDAVEENRTRARPQQSRKGQQGSRFTGAVGAQQCGNSAVREREVDALDGFDGAVMHLKSRHREKRAHSDVSPPAACSSRPK